MTPNQLARYVSHFCLFVDISTLLFPSRWAKAQTRLKVWFEGKVTKYGARLQGLNLLNTILIWLLVVYLLTLCFQGIKGQTSLAKRFIGEEVVHKMLGVTAGLSIVLISMWFWYEFRYQRLYFSKGQHLSTVAVKKLSGDNSLRITVATVATTIKGVIDQFWLD